MDVYSTSGLLGVSSTRALKLFTFGLFTTSDVKENRATMSKIWKTVMWSLKLAYRGMVRIEDCDSNPLTDEPAGKPLAGGLKFVLWSIKADLDHWAKAYGLSHYNSNEPCEYCTASRTCHWKGWRNYVGPDATWKTKCFTANQWR